ncbi:MAG: ABC transporter ATP-binding protein [Alphaproteobacteria bacterium]
MAGLSVKSVTKRFGETNVLKGVTLNVADAEFVSLVGPSGCGKSTLLRIIAGLENPTSGDIAIGDETVTDFRAADRNLSMVFQSYALYPHLTVAENIAVPLRMRSLSVSQRLPVIGSFMPGAQGKRAEITSAVENAANMLEISTLLERKPGQLSGGQRQRVALGRALVRDPAAFLLDEPLSNLDAKLRVQTRAEIAQLHRRLKATFIYVTHDQVEAMTMSDRIAVMMDGEILQCDAPSVIYDDPDDIRVAEFIGSPKINILPIECNDGKLSLFGRIFGSASKDVKKGVFQIGLRPEALCLSKSGGMLTGSIAHVENLGAEIYAQVDLTDQDVRVTFRASPAERRLLSLGALVELSFNPTDTMIFDAHGKRQRDLEFSKSKPLEIA